MVLERIVKFLTHTIVIKKIIYIYFQPCDLFSSYVMYFESHHLISSCVIYEIIYVRYMLAWCNRPKLNPSSLGFGLLYIVLL